MSRHTTKTRRFVAGTITVAGILAAAASTASAQLNRLPTTLTTVFTSTTRIAYAVSGDFNGDGRSDIAFTQQNLPFVGILLSQNVPGAPFAAPVYTNVGENGAKLVAGNFVIDGGAQRTDLAVIRPGSGDGLIYGSNGDGNLALSAIIALGDYYSDAKAADMNGDGKSELLITRTDRGPAYNQGRGVSIYTRSSGGQYTRFDAITWAQTGYGVTAADLNADGKADLTTTCATDASYSPMLLTHIDGRNWDGTASTSFGAPSWIRYVGQYFYIAPPVAVDANQDGRTDLVSFGSLRDIQSIQISYNDGNVRTDPWPRATFGLPGDHWIRSEVFAATLNRSGKPQAAWLEREANNVLGVYSIQKVGTSVQRTRMWTFPSPLNYMSVAIGDFDGDRDDDVLIHNGEKLQITGNPQANGLPTAESLVPSPESPTLGRTVTLTAKNVTDPDRDGSVAMVRFYHDINRDGVATNDEYLADGTKNGTDWIATVQVPASWGTGEHQILAIAWDELNDNTVAKTASITFRANSMPKVDGVRFDRDQGTPGQSLTLSADGVADTDEGSIREVRFYRDANRNGSLDMGDEMISSDTNGSDGWSGSASVNTSWGQGVVKFFAVSIDDLGGMSQPRENSIVISTAPAAGKPQIGWLSASNASRQWKTRLTLSAWNVSTSASAVAFYMDSNHNGQFDTGDRLVARGTPDSTGLWFSRFLIKQNMGEGPTLFFARAMNAGGEWSEPQATTVTIRARR